jgi:hypothetical protein
MRAAGQYAWCELIEEETSGWNISPAEYMVIIEESRIKGSRLDYDCEPIRIPTQPQQGFEFLEPQEVDWSRPFAGCREVVKIPVEINKDLEWCREVRMNKEGGLWTEEESCVLRLVRYDNNEARIHLVEIVQEPKLWPGIFRIGCKLSENDAEGSSWSVCDPASESRDQGAITPEPDSGKTNALVFWLLFAIGGVVVTSVVLILFGWLLRGFLGSMVSKLRKL